MKTLNFGLEVEIVNISKATAARAVQSVVGGNMEHGTNGACQVIAADGRTWNGVHDGGLSGPASQNAEVVSPILKYGDIEMFQEVIRALKKNGAKLDSSCLHCHVGAENFTVNTIKKLVRMIARNEALIEHVFQVTPARKARYCKSIDPSFLRKVNGKMTTMRQLSEAWYGFYNANPAPRSRLKEKERNGTHIRPWCSTAGPRSAGRSTPSTTAPSSGSIAWKGTRTTLSGAGSPCRATWRSGCT